MISTHKIKTIIFGLDKTIVNDGGQKTAYSIVNQIYRLKESKKQIIVATLRPYCLALKIAQQINADYLISDNGAQTYSLKDKIFIEQKHILSSVLLKILDIVNTNLFIFAFFFGQLSTQQNNIYYANKSTNSYVSKLFRKHNPVQLINSNPLLLTKINSVVIYGDFLYLEEIQQQLKTLSVDCSTNSFQNTFALTIVAKNVSKANAILQLSGLLPFNLHDQAIYFASQASDLTLAQKINYTIAMPSASQEIQQIALLKTESVQNNGFVKGLRYFFS